MIWFKNNIIQGSLLLIASIVIIAGIEVRSSLEKVKQDKQIFAVTRFNSNSFYLDANGANGFEYALANEFANWLGVTLKIRPEAGHSLVYSDLDLDLAQIGVAALSSPINADNLVYSIPYMEVNRVLIYKDKMPEAQADLENLSILVQSGSPSEYWIDQQLNLSDNKIRFEGTTTELLLALDRGTGTVAIMDSLEFEIDAGFFPKLKVAFDLTDPLPVRWAFSIHQDESLRDAANLFIKEMQESGKLGQLIERHYGTLNQFTFSGIYLFQSQIEKQLPYYKKTFIEAAAKYNIDWRLLAAIGYQESHWRRRAVSPTGVRGIMMLTLATSRMLGVKSRLDPVQSIYGGAKFYDRLTRVIPEHIPEPDRTWFALAAYNVGSGHLKDARELTSDMGFDADNWLDVMQHLPLLEKPEYYKKLKFGKARGSEPVKYVQNIRRYYDLLKWNFPLEGENPDMPEEMKQLPLPTINIPSTL